MKEAWIVSNHLCLLKYPKLVLNYYNTQNILFLIKSEILTLLFKYVSQHIWKSCYRKLISDVLWETKKAHWKILIMYVHMCVAKSMCTHTFMTDTHTHKLLIHNDKKITRVNVKFREKLITPHKQFAKVTTELNGWHEAHKGAIRVEWCKGK